MADIRLRQSKKGHYTLYDEESYITAHSDYLYGANNGTRLSPSAKKAEPLGKLPRSGASN